MRAAAAKWNLYIGYTYPEASNGNFYEAFALVSPDGTEWKCRKTQPSGAEAFVFDKAAFNSVLRTPIGVFGVQIGTENFLRRHQQDTVEGLQHLPDGRHDLDLILSPSAHAAPLPGL